MWARPCYVPLMRDATTPPDPRPFFLEGKAGPRGGSTGVLLLHGFLGAPAEMRLLGEHLAGAGYGVLAPRLAGHGTAPRDLDHVRWPDWVASAQLALDELLVAHERAYVVGLSMGALLAIRLCAERPEPMGAVLMSAALRVSVPGLGVARGLSRYVPYVPLSPRGLHALVDPEGSRHVWSYPRAPLGAIAEFHALQRDVLARLHRLTKPILVVQGRRDVLVPASSARMLYERAASKDKSLCWLPRSGHLVTVDRERAELQRTVAGWLAERG